MAIYAASFPGNECILKKFMECASGANDDYIVSAILMVAFQNGYMDIVKGAFRTQKNAMLCEAPLYAPLSVIEALTEVADVNSRVSMTPLGAAVVMDRADVVKFLLQKGAIPRDEKVRNYIKELEIKELKARVKELEAQLSTREGEY